MRAATVIHVNVTRAPDLSQVSIEGGVVPAGKREHGVVEAPAADGGTLVLGGVHEVREQPGESVLGAPSGNT